MVGQPALWLIKFLLAFITIFGVARALPLSKLTINRKLTAPAVAMVESTYPYLPDQEGVIKLFHSVLRRTSTKEVKPLPPIVILHGLLGSSKNFQSWVKLLHIKEGGRRDIICMDMRNHGRTATAYGPLPMDYRLMAKDVMRTLKELKVNLAHIVGHSMGGKVTAALALLVSPEFNALDIISATLMDISPVDYSEDAVFTDVYATLDVVAQLESQISKLTTRQEVSAMLDQFVSDPVLKAFLLSSIQPAERGGFEWKFAIQGIDQSRKNLAIFEPSSRSTSSTGSEGTDASTVAISFQRPTLVMKGSESKFVRSSHMATISAYFPLFTLLAVKNAGHWIHAERPEESANSLLRFLTTVEERYKISDRFP